ncbi:MAG TPA: efflux RND transporter periplasmic adaptor subunit [Kofleriaceae bacterium]|nr:efflux RND transporter periplasmic adaptor subunit [Kofleriaceae bacterium]
MASETASIDPALHRPNRRRLVLTGAVAAIAVSTLVIAGVVPRIRGAAEVENDRERAASEPAHIEVALPHRQSDGGKIALPGTVQAVQEAVVNARSTGYIHSYTVDIGDAIKAGQVMATLDTPDIDEELRAGEAAAAQASANIEQAKTQLTLAGTESTRYQTLAGSGVVSQQDMEEHKASFDARGASLRATEAALHTAEANVQRLRDLKQFATIVAPFDGVVTVRNVEIGQLVTAGTGQAMFRVANTNIVRVFVNVPQVYAPGVKIDDTAATVLREFPNRTFAGKVTRTSRALDPATRTLTAEIRIPNADGALLPGMYASIALQVNRVDSPLMIAPSSLVADASGTRVAVVDHGAIHWRAVKVDSNMGDEVAILSGLGDRDQVVVAPSERLSEGLAVDAKLAPPVRAAGSPAPQGDQARGAPTPGVPATSEPRKP